MLAVVVKYTAVVWQMEGINAKRCEDLLVDASDVKWQPDNRSPDLKPGTG